MAPEDPRFQDYLTRHYTQLGDAERHRAGRKRQLLETYRRWLPANRDAAMLEIGPGFGHLLEILRTDLGYRNATAVDVSREVVAYLEQRLPGSTTYVEDTAAWLRAHPGQWEQVFALHVIEHVPRDAVADFLAAVRGALRPGGRVVLELPNMANLFTGGFLRWADLTHEWGYTEQSLHQLLTACGFTGVTCFEERVPPGLKGVAAGAFRALARGAQRIVYRGYQLPVPRVLGPALCATAVRPTGDR